MKALARIAIAAAALALVGAAAGAAPKVKLTVAISGSGFVTSSPKGIDCRPGCSTTVRKGAKVVLTATPNSGAEFSRWSAPCGSNDTCTVKMTAAKTVRAYFKVEPKPPAPPPPAPPPPAPKSGHYVGTYTDGTFFFFDLNGTAITKVNFDFNGHCDNGGNSYDDGIYLNGPFTVGSDGTFSGKATLTFSNATITPTVTGTVTTSGSASGSLSIQIAFNDGVNCTSSGTWTAQLQS